MKPVLVSGTAGTQMPLFIAILIRWIPSSQPRIVAEALVSIPMYQASGMKMWRQVHGLQISYELCTWGLELLVVLISSFMWGPELLSWVVVAQDTPGCNQDVSVVGQLGEVTVIIGTPWTAAFQTQSCWSPHRVPHDTAAAPHIII